MKLPFTLEEFLQVFATYNQTVWPMQIVFNLLALFAIVSVIKTYRRADAVISGILAFFWLWIGIVYHFWHFTTINKAAYLFGMLCVIQGMIFFIAGVIKSKLSFIYQTSLSGIVGSLFLLYSLLIYPLLGYLLGHRYPQLPTFGLPCPTTIFTFGLLLWTKSPFPRYLLIIPTLWSVIGFGAAISLTIREDIGLLVAGIVGSLLLVLRERKRARA